MRQPEATKRERSSEATTDHQIPSIPQISGRIITVATWKTTVLKKATTAETRPLLRAVKKPEAKMLKPTKRKEKALIRTARFVISKRTGS